MSGNQGMEQLIPLVNKLQDAFSSLKVPLALDLPQIAVVGCQSAGKSSVLENFVGRDFLPRGSGIVTRRPLILQLVNDKAVLNLTLIDLPGLTKIAVGDQPADIEIRIRNMIIEFIEKENCLILAVTPANTDLANSDALKLAKEYDPKGLRTIGVLTKLDLMEDGTDAKDILENRLLPLRRGYVGVVNRGQRDIDSNKEIADALGAEKRFFLTHPSYHHMADRMGTPYLQHVLNQQLISHIREALPSLSNKLQSQLLIVEKKVLDYQSLRSDDPNYKTSTLLRMVRSFEEDFCKRIEGYSSDVDTTTLSTGAKIGGIFHERFPCELSAIRFDKIILRKEISVAIRNIHGVRLGIFTPDRAFDATVRSLIDKLRPPSMHCVDLVVQELTNVVQLCSQRTDRFPQLRDELMRLANMRIRELEVSTRDQIQHMIDYHLAYMNTNHEDFIGFRNAEKKSKDPSREFVTQTICKGWLSLVNPNLMRGGSRYFWFVLKTDNLTWFKDDEEREVKYVLQLNGLKQRGGDTGFFSRRATIVIFSPDPKANVYKDHKTLDISADTRESADMWKAALHRAGVFPEQTAEKKDEAEGAEETNDPQLERQVEVISCLVDSYMKIINKTQEDMVPKVIMHELINRLKTFLDQELLPIIYSQDMNSLMQESETERQNREDTISLFECLKLALETIRQVLSTTQSAPVPPPLKDDWLDTAVAATNPPTRRTQGSGNHLGPPALSPQRPITPPPGTGGGSGISSTHRPVPNRPAPNLPNRFNQPSPMPGQPVLQPVPHIPHRGILAANGVTQSASTGNLAGMGFTAPRTVHGADSLGSAGWKTFDPLNSSGNTSSTTNTSHVNPPVPPPKVASLGDHLSGQERSTSSQSAVPRIPPRPN